MRARIIHHYPLHACGWFFAGLLAGMLISALLFTAPRAPIIQNVTDTEVTV